MPNLIHNCYSKDEFFDFVLKHSCGPVNIIENPDPHIFVMKCQRCKEEWRLQVAQPM